MRDPSYWRRFAYAVLAFAVVLAVGTVGFQALLGEGWVASFYRSVVSTTLTGLASAPDSNAGKIFTVVLLFAGVAVFFYIAGVVVDTITRGVLSDVFGERRRRREIEALRDHVIVCGYGRVGRRAVLEFREVGVPYVVLDHGAEAIAYAQSHGDAYIEGRGTQDDDLQRAGIFRARALIACSDSDVDNLYITLSARALRDDLFIVARASTTDARSKLELVGADRVVQLYATAGLNMANLVLKPQVSEFLDIVSTAGGPMPELQFEEIVVDEACEPCGRTIGELRIRRQTGALVIALRKADGAFDPTPDAAAVLEAGDVLIGVGTTDEMARLEALFAPSEATVV